ncbi:cobalamin biosynthesis family protein [Vibrio gazogenes]|uniref:Adenosylcobinamide-phosphate synthase n=1 Tax=Vibrio gazogenes DSM 21264 = NBRC 103151 TaxID=1123492 RepID=A0A1M4WSP6_VIBGA|nr:cobalamin biosynthesis family protein [Vibrio gazogenes]USP13137.1 cobalamin biosynthesis family protein [Vibrio gazogenes]SHE84244.1 adenosylcobinamide-phosphate synthase [Vibrio gazogenes DSM 21264] [Vibrio gazogenes DSM 21264 = NBRC 103151]SJN55336.1 adenosylcobinamide-phosphate synthase [Vibrio gazogenes]
MSHIQELLQTQSALLIMWGALLIHLILPLPRAAHPALLWHKFAEILADKVNTQGSYAQRTLSGTLATFLMLIPALMVLVALEPLVWQPELYHLLLLILALDWRGLTTLSKPLFQALAVQDKPQARQLLAERLNRQTDTLSVVGLGKASAELLIVGQARQVITVLFWYGLLGGIGAFMYRLIVELSRVWSPSVPANYPFGLAASRLNVWCEWIPSHLFALLLMMGQSLSSTWTQTRQQSCTWPSRTAGWLLCSVGHKLNLSLGGPAIYEGKKSVRAKLGGRVVPSVLHLSQIQRLLNQRTYIWIGVESLLILIATQLL